MGGASAPPVLSLVGGFKVPFAKCGMRMMQPFLWDYWYFHLPNYALSVLIYTLLGRFLLGMLVPPESSNYIWRFFVRITDPVLRFARLLIPDYVAPGLRPLAAAFHLYVLRLAMFIAMYAQGMVPRLEGIPPVG